MPDRDRLIQFRPLGTEPVEFRGSRRGLVIALAIGVGFVILGVGFSFTAAPSGGRALFKHWGAIWGSLVVGGFFTTAALWKLAAQPCAMEVSAEGVGVRDFVFWKRVRWEDLEAVERHRWRKLTRLWLRNERMIYPMVIGGHYPIDEVLRAIGRFGPPGLVVREITHKDRKTLPESFWDDII